MDTDLSVCKASSALRDCSVRAQQLQQHRNTAPNIQCTDKMSMSKPFANTQLQQQRSALDEVCGASSRVRSQNVAAGVQSTPAGCVPLEAAAGVHTEPLQVAAITAAGFHKPPGSGCWHTTQD